MSYPAVAVPIGRLLFEERYAVQVPEDSLLSYIAARMEEVRSHYALPVSRQHLSIAERFHALAQRWRDETRFLSSATDLAMHPAYQEMIALGPAALPLVLAELEREPGHWFWALRALTGLDPVSPERRGRVNAMRQAWLDWAKEAGVRW